MPQGAIPNYCHGIMRKLFYRIEFRRRKKKKAGGNGIKRIKWNSMKLLESYWRIHMDRSRFLAT